MKANKKLIQQKISKETGKVVLLKDICNIATVAMQGRSRNNLDASVQTLTDKCDWLCKNPHSMHQN